MEGQVRLELKKLELRKLQDKLNNQRKEWVARVDELKTAERKFLSKKHEQEGLLGDNLAREQLLAQEAMAEARRSFDEQMSFLTRERDKLQQRYQDQKRTQQQETELSRLDSLKNSSEINRLSNDYTTKMQAYAAKVASLRKAMERDSDRRLELEAHFEKVDRNELVKTLEEEKLNVVAAKEEKVSKILYRGASVFQALWRGVVSRKEYEKLKNKKKTKKKTGKGSKGKKLKKF